jgi:hypothetical protein
MAIDVEPRSTEFADAGLGDLRAKNPVYRKMGELRQRTVEVIVGRTRLLIVYGPPGIGKSIAVYQMLDVHYQRSKRQWDDQEQKDDRRTMQGENGEQAFRPPFSVIQGGTSLPVFFCNMFWASCPQEILLIDDVSSIRNKLIQAALQQATDPTTNGMCYYNYRARLPDESVPKRYQFRGGIIILTNYRKLEGGKEHRMDNAGAGPHPLIEETFMIDVIGTERSGLGLGPDDNFDNLSAKIYLWQRMTRLMEERGQSGPL